MGGRECGKRGGDMESKDKFIRTLPSLHVDKNFTLRIKIDKQC